MTKTIRSIVFCDLVPYWHFLWVVAVVGILTVANITTGQNLTYSDTDGIVPNGTDDGNDNQINIIQFEQVHISLGGNENEMVLTWTSLYNYSDQTRIHYGINPDQLTNLNSEIVEVIKLKGYIFIYRTILLDLLPQTVYYYRISGNGAKLSKQYQFRTLKVGPEWLPSFAIYGDLGLKNDQSLPFLKSDVYNDLYDVIFHIGDFAYDLHERKGQQGNDFMNSIEEIASRVPYMTCPGNHERHSNFTHYDARFSMIDGDQDLSKNDNNDNGNNDVQDSRFGYDSDNELYSWNDMFDDSQMSWLNDDDYYNNNNGDYGYIRNRMKKKNRKIAIPLTKRINNHYYSFDIGPAHIIMFSTEFHFYTQYGWEQIRRQYEFLENDLEKANKNREIRPWIIVMGHRPLYCLRAKDKSCNLKTFEREPIRSGVYWKNETNSTTATDDRLYGLESLFYRHGVDVQFYGHEHFYTRLWPVYDYQTLNGTKSLDNPYEDPRGPIHITTGSAGNRERHTKFNSKIKELDWVAFNAYDYGYTRLKFKSAKHLLLEQVSVEQNGTIIDTINIIKNQWKPNWI